MIGSFQTTIMFKYSTHLPRLKFQFYRKHRPQYNGNFDLSQKYCNRNVIKSEKFNFFACFGI